MKRILLVEDSADVIKRVRKSPGLASVPAIALTEASVEKDIQRALAAGFTAHLIKPVELDELHRRIEQLTTQRLQRKTG